MYCKRPPFERKVMGLQEKSGFSLENPMFSGLPTNFLEAEDNVGLCGPLEVKHDKKENQNMLNCIRDLIYPVAFSIGKSVRESLSSQCLYIEQTGRIADFSREVNKRRQLLLEHEALLSSIELPLSVVEDKIQQMKQGIQELNEKRHQLLTLRPCNQVTEKQKALDKLEEEKLKQLSRATGLAQSIGKIRNKKLQIESKLTQFPLLREKHNALQKLMEEKEKELCQLLTERNKLLEERAVVRSPKYGPRCRCSHGLWKTQLEADVKKWETLEQRFQGITLKNTRGLVDRMSGMTDGLEYEICKAVYLALRSELGARRFEYMGNALQEEYVCEVMDIMGPSFEFHPFCHLDYKVENGEIDMSLTRVEDVHKMFFEMLKWHVRNMAKGVTWKIKAKLGCLRPLNENDDEGIPTEEQAVSRTTTENGIYFHPWEPVFPSVSVSSLVETWEETRTQFSYKDMAREAYERCLISLPLVFRLIPKETALGELERVMTEMSGSYTQNLLERGTVKSVFHFPCPLGALLTQSEEHEVMGIVRSVFDDSILSVVREPV